ncbi:hypothetical protein EV1_026179 [Malus domestica]
MGRDRRGWRPFRKFQKIFKFLDGSRPSRLLKFLDGSSRESVGPRYLLMPVRKFQSSELEEKYRVTDIEVDDHPTPELPSEIIFTHILPRLPPKFLIKQCSSVCKSWSSLIRHHSFVTAYRNFQCSKGTTNLLLRKGDRFFSSQLNQEGNLTPATRLSTIDIEPKYYYSGVRSLDGLLVIGSDGDGPVTISNPSTGESIQLPHEKIDRKICPTYYIGFSPFTNEYKVLQILLGFDEKEDTIITLNIFTLGMDYSWRPLQVDVGDLPFDLQHPPFDMRSDRRSVCLHGAIHWLHEQSQSILVFDLGDEAFRVIPLPQEYDYTREWEWNVFIPYLGPRIFGPWALYLGLTLKPILCKRGGAPYSIKGDSSPHSRGGSFSPSDLILRGQFLSFSSPLSKLSLIELFLSLTSQRNIIQSVWT